MSYIGSQPTTAAFPFDQFSGNGTTTSFTLTYAPASATSIIVTINGVVQNPNLYSVIGTTLSFSPAPPTGTNNIAVLYLGLPVIGVSSPGNTAYLSTTDFTATAGQTTFAPSGSYQVGFVQVFRNGARLGNADYTATNGTTVTLTNPCVAGDLVSIQVYTLTSISNALPLTGGTVTGATSFNSTVAVNGAYVSGFTGFKNRIINPGMVIDQRNNGASFSPTTSSGYSLDRWVARVTQNSKLTIQRNAGTIAPPTGFSNYIGITSSSAYSVLANDTFTLAQAIEGFNTADLNFGSASASAVTLSFWVCSSLTGTFGGALTNAGVNRSYPFSYTVSAANTWEYKTVTVAGDTTGTWLTNNSTGIEVRFGLGSGSSFSGTVGTWQSGNIVQPTGTVSVVGTSGATFYLTGVQLERGSNATSFEFRSIGQELALCQRYTHVFGGPSSGASNMLGGMNSTARIRCVFQYPVTLRAAPTLTLVGSPSGYSYGATNPTYSSVVSLVGTPDSASVDVNVVNGNSQGLVCGLTFSTTAYIISSAEL